jgi:nucleoid DNA-binding protein
MSKKRGSVQNPFTGEKIKIKASKSVNFKLSIGLKDKIN